MKGLRSVKVGVLVDEKARPGLRGAYGLSLLVDAGSWRALIDTGSSDEVLEHNARALGVDLSSLDFVVITHEHPDHVGGLAALARAGLKTPVYVPAGSSWRLEKRLEELGLQARRSLTGGEVAPGALLLGQQYGPPYEHALAVRLEGAGLITIHGCSHPGPSRIVAKAVNDTGVTAYAVVGGLHLAWSEPDRVRSEVAALRSLGVRVLAPLHCSGDRVVAEARSAGIEVREAIAGDWITLP